MWSPHQTIIAYFCAFFGNLAVFWRALVVACHIMTFFMSLLLFLSDTSVFNQGDLFQQVLAKITMGDSFQREALWQCLVSTTCSTYSFDKHITSFNKFVALGKAVSWLQVFRLSLSLRLAVTCNHLFAVLRSGAFVWSTSQHQKDCTILGFPWLVFRVCARGCPLCLYSADTEMVDMEFKARM